MNKPEPNQSQTSVAADSVEIVYAEKYDWLLRWALHFCGGDRETAEDLVQDTFLQMLSSWPTIREIAQPERFLYTYLRYGFLRYRNLGRRLVLQEYLPREFEALPGALNSDRANTLVWQEEIRGVVDFLCWRKETAKSASLLLLRLFHGFFPAEIMDIAKLSRKAVDEGLANAKEEARTHCTHPQKLQVMHSGVPPVLAGTCHSILPLEEFMQAMQEAIFSSCHGVCLKPADLTRHYSDQDQSPIGCRLLGHLVSCASCLDTVIRSMGLPPRGTRPLEEVLSYAPRAESKHSSERALGNIGPVLSLEAAKKRYRRTFEHIPKSLMVFVNGDLVASRDLTSSLNEITIELKGSNTPELIEITSDRALLLTIPVTCQPPEAPPEQWFETALSGGRRIAVRLDFTATGARMHAVYEDPSAVRAESPCEVPGGTLREPAVVADETPSSRGSSFWEWIRTRFGLRVGVLTAGVVLGMGAFLVSTRLDRPRASEVLMQAVGAAVNLPAVGVECQVVRISSKHGVFIETLHRDLAGKHRTKHPKLNPDQTVTESELSAAGVERNDPLSALSFRDWHSHQQNSKDSVKRREGNLLTLTTELQYGSIREESITFRADTLHPVIRTVDFRDEGHIEVAELDYRVLPWGKSDSEWFEPPPVDSVRTASIAGPGRSLLPSLVPPLSQADLDNAEIGARLALIELKADVQERLTILRNTKGVSVTGLVATGQRLREIESRLRTVPHLSTSIETFAEFERRTNEQSKETGVMIASSPEAPSPLDLILTKQRRSPDEAIMLHRMFLDAAYGLRQSAIASRDLDSEFQQSQLSDEGRIQLDLLARTYNSRAHAAAATEAQALSLLGTQPAPGKTPFASTFVSAALVNSQLCFELISHQSDTPRPAEAILSELSSSIGDLEFTLERTPLLPLQVADPANHALHSATQHQ